MVGGNQPCGDRCHPAAEGREMGEKGKLDAQSTSCLIKLPLKIVRDEWFLHVSVKIMVLHCEICAFIKLIHIEI